MNLSAVKLSPMRALVAVASYGNFSEAALDLSISQSAVSHAIATLEDALGVVLLSRGRHGATLTPVGERVLHYAQVMLNTLEDIGREANLAKGLDGGHLRLVSFRSAAPTFCLASLLNSASGFRGLPSALWSIAATKGWNKR